MKQMRSTVILIGWLAAFSVGAEQPPGQVAPQYAQFDAVPARGPGVGDLAEPGLSGDYAVSLDAPGTASQPDSTPLEDRDDRSHRGTASAAPATDYASLDEGIRLIRRIPHDGTFGWQAAAADASRGAGGASYLQFHDAAGEAMHMRQDGYGRSPGDLGATYSFPLSRRSSVFGYIGSHGEPAFGPPASFARHFPNLDDPQAPVLNNWLEAPAVHSEVFTFGYAWRKLKVESSTFSSREPDPQYVRTGLRKLDSSSRRLSFSPSPNWAVQFSRGTIGTLDQVDPNPGIRRTAISATYNRAFNDGNLQTTVAWGRNARKFREATVGYLVESTLKLRKSHAFFSRLEQVGSDDLLRENGSLPTQLFKMNKVTVGYVHEVPVHGGVGYDLGGLMSRHLVPAAMTASYGNDPTSYMMFVRLKLK